MADLEQFQTEIPGDAKRGSLKELALFFLRLGVTAFGGPAAHIAMMEDELVRRRKWLSREKFLDLLGASSLIPGPSSSELAIHIGYLRAGWAGLLIGGGVEYAFSPNWTGKVEYNSIFVRDNVNFTVCGPGACAVTSTQSAAKQTVKVGINYMFH